MLILRGKGGGGGRLEGGERNIIVLSRSSSPLFVRRVAQNPVSRGPGAFARTSLGDLRSCLYDIHKNVL